MTCCTQSRETHLCIAPGRAFEWQFLAAESTWRYAEIDAYTGIAPLLAVSPAHELTAGWPVSIVDASGRIPDTGPNPAVVVDADTLELDAVGPMPEWSGGFEPYSGGHFFKSHVPLDLTDATAHWEVFHGEETLLSLPATVDEAEHSVTVTLTETDTQDLRWLFGRHELRLELADGSERTLASGTVCVGMGGLQDPMRALSVTLDGVGASGGTAEVP